MQKQVVRRKYPEFEAKVAQMPEYKQFAPSLPGLTITPATPPAATGAGGPIPSGTPKASGGEK